MNIKEAIKTDNQPVIKQYITDNLPNLLVEWNTLESIYNLAVKNKCYISNYIPNEEFSNRYNNLISEVIKSLK